MKRILRQAAIVTTVLLLILGTTTVPIRAAVGTLTITPPNGIPGVSVTLTGSSFAPNEPSITLTYDGTIVSTGVISANSTGGWIFPFIIPPSASGSHILTATGPGTTATSTFIVIPAISASKTTGSSGSVITITGAGFAANEANISVIFDGNTATPIGTVAVASAQGGWTASVTIPNATAGTHTIDAYGTNTTAVSVLDINFVVSAGISASKTSGASGTSITVTGTGFSPGETGITVTYDGTTVASSITATPQGGWTATFTVPSSASGSHTIAAYGSATTAAGITPITFTVNPTITAGRQSGAAGSSLTITGTSFVTGEGGITVTYDGNAVAQGISANEKGGWTANFNIPPSTAGAHKINAFGSVTPVASVPELSFTVIPGVTASRTSGPPGISVVISGTSFGPSEAGIAITYDNNPIASGITANANGAWSATITVPASAAGQHVIDVAGASTAANLVPDISFTVSPGITASKASGSTGSSMTITGSGFAPSESGITVTYDGKPVASDIKANAQGSWKATINIPPSTAGSHSIEAQGSVTQASSASDVGFNITPTITANPDFGNIGMAVEISGVGFAANSPVRFSYDGKDLSTDSGMTDGSGSFAKSITIPKSKAGAHSIRALDGQSNESKINFSVESVAPIVPSLLSPDDGASVGLMGGARPEFRWSAVTDPSSVTFTLQIDASSDFTQPIFEKTDIPSNRYNLSATDALPPGEYYWRVKAIDGAGNASAWSQTRMLKSGAMSMGLLVTIIIAGLAVIAIAVFLVLRRRARKPAPAPVPVVETPQVVRAQWRTIESEEIPGERQLGQGSGERLPWRLALPEAKKGPAFSTEDQARLKVIMDFAGSLPLAQPGYNVDWLVDMIESSMGVQMSAPVYEQLLSGELQVRYEPAWMRHPTYQDLLTLLEGQSVLQELNDFVASVDRCAGEAVLLLQDIYHEATAELPPDFLQNGGWAFISAVYADAVSWTLGKSLRDPSERDYSIKKDKDADDAAEARWLWGEPSTSFAGQLVKAANETEAAQLRTLHLKLRRSFRSNSRARQVGVMCTQLEVQRSRLLNVFSQLSQLKQ